MQEVFCDGWVGLYNIKTITSMESPRKDIKTSLCVSVPSHVMGKVWGKTWRPNMNEMVNE